MSLFFGKSKKPKPEYTSFQTQTSSQVMAFPLVWGRTRIAPNIIWYGDFQAHKQKQKNGKGFGAGSTIYYTYTASLILALCEGPISDVGKMWKDQSSKSSYADAGFTLFTGTTPQSPWGYLSTKHPSQALNYPGVAYLAVANYDLGQTNTLGNHSFEVFAQQYNTQVDGDGDADPAVVSDEFLTSPAYGVNFPASSIDYDTLMSGPDAPTTGDSAFQTYCRAMGLGMSPALMSQETASNIIDRWGRIFNTAIVRTGYNLKFVPYGDQEIDGHGVKYIPPTTVRYSLTDSDYLSPGDDPIQMLRSDPADAMNSLKLKIRDRANDYNEAPIEWKDQALIDQFGLRPANIFDASEICDLNMGAVIAALMGQRQAYIRNTYKTKIGARYCRLEPMDIITCTDPRWGLFSVRITSIEEGDDDNLALTVEEFPAGVSVSPGFGTQAGAGAPYNTDQGAGPANPPIILEPPSSVTGGTAQVWMAVSGGDGVDVDPEWGGCYVYISTDNVTFQQVGQIDTPARMGILGTNLPAYGGSNPDTVNTLQADLSMSGGDLVSVTSADAEAEVTLSVVKDVGGTVEYLSYQDATLVSGFVYDLDTELWRGLHGTVAGSHLAGAAYARLDEAIFKFDLTAQYIGVPLYVKLQSYNIWGMGLEDLSTCTVYTYTPDGTGFGGGTDGVPTVPTGLVGYPGIEQNTLAWNANPITDNVTVYRLFRATGTGQLFGSASLVAIVTGQIWNDTGLLPDQGYTYFLEAVNTVGASLPTAGVDVTTSLVSVDTFRLYGSLDRMPLAGEELFDIEMNGDEHFDAGLPLNLGGCDVAATADADFPIYLNGVQIGYARVAAASTTMTWTMASALSPAQGDRLKFTAPIVQDVTLSGPRYTYIGKRV